MTDISPQPSENADHFHSQELQSQTAIAKTILTGWANTLITNNKINVLSTNVSDMQTGESAAFGVFSFPDPEVMGSPDGQRTTQEVRLVYVKPNEQSTEDGLDTREKVVVKLPVQDVQLAVLDPSPVESSMLISQSTVPVDANGTLLYNQLAKDYTVQMDSDNPTQEQLAMIQRAITLIQEHAPIGPKPVVD